MKTTPMFLALCFLALAGLSGCASSGDTSSMGKIGPDYDSPMSQQIRQQEAMSRVTRTLTP